MAETIQTKQCSKCKQIKLVSEFHTRKNRKSGYHSHCKRCRRKYRVKYLSSEQGKQKLYEYNHSKKSRDSHKKAIKKYLNTIKGKIYSKNNAEKHWNKYPERLVAKRKVNQAVVNGKLPNIKTKKCNMCNKQAEHYHHNKGYNPKHWLDVIPLCRKCHYNIHNRPTQ